MPSSNRACLECCKKDCTYPPTNTRTCYCYGTTGWLHCSHAKVFFVVCCLFVGFPTIRTHLQFETRWATCRTVAACLTGSTSSSPQHSGGVDSLLLTPWLDRSRDAKPEIRTVVAQHIFLLMRHLVAHSVPGIAAAHAGESSSSSLTANSTSLELDKVVRLAERLLTDGHAMVRVAAVQALCTDYLHPTVTTASLQQDPHRRRTWNRMVRRLVALTTGIPIKEQQSVWKALIRLWVRAAWGPLASLVVVGGEDDDTHAKEDEDATLFCSLLVQHLDPSSAHGPRRTEPTAAETTPTKTTEPFFVEWLPRRLFSMATSNQQSRHQQPQQSQSHRSHPRTHHPPQPPHGDSWMFPQLEAGLHHGWYRYVSKNHNKKNKGGTHTNSTTTTTTTIRKQVAAALSLWHRVPRPWIVSWAHTRARRQDTLSEYLEAREATRTAPKGRNPRTTNGTEPICVCRIPKSHSMPCRFAWLHVLSIIGTEEALAADARAMEVLRRLSLLMGHGMDEKGGDEQQHKMLLAFHGFRDKQVFRLLSTIANPCHSPNARQRALEHVPSRLVAFLDNPTVAQFAREIVEKTAMPDFMNYSILGDLIQVAYEHGPLRSQALTIVSAIVGPLSKMASPAWNPLTSLLEQSLSNSKSKDGSDEESDELDSETTDLITSILASSAMYATSSDSLPSCMIDLCRHGTPDQASNSAKAMVHFYTQVHDDKDATDKTLSLMDNLSSELSLSEPCPTLTVLASLTALVETVPTNAEVMEAATQDIWRFCLKALLQKNDDKLSSSPRRKRGRSRSMPESGGESLYRGAIEFLVHFVRAYIFANTPEAAKTFVKRHNNDIQRIMSRLVELSHSSTVAYEVKECATIHVCRLCDPRLRLEPVFLTTHLWLLFSKSFLDDSPVRDCLYREFPLLLTGGGVYGEEGSPKPPEAPSLRLVSLHMFLQAKQIKVAATQCISILRDTCDKAYGQCRTLGRKATERFESVHKMRLMPEYMVPLGLYLLLFHSNEDDEKTLRRRLKLLTEPLVHSLGDTADNISFLLRMTEHLGANYEAVSPKTFDSPISCDIVFVCKIAREVLLSLVKKDVNLSPYGTIHVPSWLFLRKSSSKEESPKALPAGTEQKNARPSSMKKQDLVASKRKSAGLHVQFSPDASQHVREIRPPSTDLEDKSSFGGLSPIAKSSPGDSTRVSDFSNSTASKTTKSHRRDSPNKPETDASQDMEAAVSSQSTASTGNSEAQSSTMSSVSRNKVDRKSGSRGKDLREEDQANGSVEMEAPSSSQSSVSPNKKSGRQSKSLDGDIPKTTQMDGSSGKAGRASSQSTESSSESKGRYSKSSNVSRKRAGRTSNTSLSASEGSPRKRSRHSKHDQQAKSQQLIPNQMQMGKTKDRNKLSHGKSQPSSNLDFESEDETAENLQNFVPRKIDVTIKASKKKRTKKKPLASRAS